ncbi:MAG: transcriptional repressor LexA [Ruminococcaceae bacterium]|nr:transcriptional repressor LexA [Oscillospiraceae bacterium]
MAKRVNREQEILDFINEQVHEKGYPPSIREICAAVGLNSPSTVHTYLKKLEEKGQLVKDGSKTRAIRLTETEAERMAEPISEYLSVPVVGSVAAGTPILAEENVTDTFPLPMIFAKNKNVFMLKVKGDSMINAGIFHGDYVIVTQQETARNGDIVVALLDDSATVKTFYQEKDYIRLQPENDALSPILVREVRILGKVSGVFRIY